MKEIADHILDILENPVKAGAATVDLQLGFGDTVFWFTMTDDGPGFPPGVVSDPTDPYRTTRTTRAVGLGLALLRHAAERTGGSVEVGNLPTGGARVHARIDVSHVDAQPLGDVGAMILAAVQAWPDVNLRITVGCEAAEVLNTGLVRAELDGLPFTHPAVREFLQATLTDGLSELTAWAERTAFGSR